MKKLLPLLLLAACATPTQLTDVYHSPYAVFYTFDKVAAIVLDGDPAVRQAAEAELVKQIGPNAVAGSTIFTPAEAEDPSALLAKLQGLGIDGAVTMRLLSNTDQPIGIDGNVPALYKGFTTYFGNVTPNRVAWGDVSRVETAIFDIKRNDLLWSAASTTASKDPATVVAGVSKAVAGELKRVKLRG